ncbi:type II toxin-antitoxin system RelE/ParE family toxin [Candidatus Sororendozoicomonas aggregata]|uniref:type II toxin-antitoxin system RelE/ParE family toxin n=1 Tax=Candidatus Sororendozoicomonas aggregata TaxID=3073239 RepID=UPI002ED50B1A
MSRLIWSPSALRDVQRLHPFLANKDEKSASRAIKTIRSSVKILAHQPEVGRPVDGMEPEFRKWLIDFGSSGYVALYRTENALTTLLAVRHQREAGY